MNIEWKLEVNIVKADEPRRIVYGIPLRSGVVDSQGDTITPEEVERAAHKFLIESQTYDLNHNSLIPRNKLSVVESYLAPMDFKIGEYSVSKGDWVLVTKIFDDELWEAVENGELQGYSIKGRGQRAERSNKEKPLYSF